MTFIQFCFQITSDVRRVLRNQLESEFILEDQTTQWPKEKRQKDKQQSTKHTQKSKD